MLVLGAIMPTFQRVPGHRLLCTRLRAFPKILHKAKAGELLRPRPARTILGRNYLIAQQLPTSSP